MEPEAKELAALPFAVGRTAEVYAWGEEQVLKLYRPEMPQGMAEREERIARVVMKAQVGAPPVVGLVTVKGRRGVIYGRVKGASMLEQIQRRPWTSARLAQVFGRLHAAMHTVQRPELPPVHDSLRTAIAQAPNLPQDLRAACLARLEMLPKGTAVCHGDYHPDNLILTDSEPVVIDWVTAGCGNPDADVARTVLLLRLGEPLGLGLVQRGLIRLLRRQVLRSYLSAYRTDRSCPDEAIAAWMPVVAAARLHEQILSEREQLLALARITLRSAYGG
jgi:aminoglycoside phosphotransferase (APT) family kinase protein